MDMELSLKNDMLTVGAPLEGRLPCLPKSKTVSQYWRQTCLPNELKAKVVSSVRTYLSHKRNLFQCSVPELCLLESFTITPLNLTASLLPQWQPYTVQTQSLTLPQCYMVSCQYSLPVLLSYKLLNQTLGFSTNRLLTGYWYVAHSDETPLFDSKTVTNKNKSSFGNSSSQMSFHSSFYYYTIFRTYHVE